MIFTKKNNIVTLTGLSILIGLVILIIWNKNYFIIRYYNSAYALPGRASVDRSPALNIQGENNINNIKKYQNAMQFERGFYDTAFSFAHNDGFSEKNIVAAIVPHHLLAADLVARIFQGLKEQKYDTIILLSPNHFLAGSGKIITTREDWQTPYGVLENDNIVTDELLKDNDVKEEEAPFGNEHGIFNEIGFIKRTFPTAKVVPLIFMPGVDEGVTRRLVDILDKINPPTLPALKLRQAGPQYTGANKKVLVLVSADFSHNTDSETAIKNNEKNLEILNNSDFKNFTQIKVDTPPAIFTVLKYAQANGAKFKMIDNANSEILSGEKGLKNVTSYITGYFYVVN